MRFQGMKSLSEETFESGGAAVEAKRRENKKGEAAGASPRGLILYEASC
jgi:hypothetical protein